jgi:hypothetical protein
LCMLSSLQDAPSYDAPVLSLALSSLAMLSSVQPPPSLVSFKLNSCFWKWFTLVMCDVQYDSAVKCSVSLPRYEAVRDQSQKTFFLQVACINNVWMIWLLWSSVWRMLLQFGGKTLLYIL